jgi:hypothetical protein
MKHPKIQEVLMELEDLFSGFQILHYYIEVNGVSPGNGMAIPKLPL